ncbi:IreB family regulatory phosphoprotein [Parvimonas sp. G1604]|uniref:IreB family regulatory phosphoprotein n=1 Tax=Parvimonas sp. G1604 TaxID=3388845 RepID=UPI0039810BEF
MSNEFNETMRIEIPRDKKSVKEIIKIVYSALENKGYNPKDQIIGYILSGDPTYITSYNNARGLIRQVSRDEILEEFLENYIKD